MDLNTQFFSLDGRWMTQFHLHQVSQNIWLKGAAMLEEDTKMKMVTTEGNRQTPDSLVNVHGVACSPTLTSNMYILQPATRGATETLWPPFWGAVMASICLPHYVEPNSAVFGKQMEVQWTD